MRTLSLALLLLASCTGLCAQETPAPASDTILEELKKYDVNGDGKLHPPEIEAYFTAKRTKKLLEQVDEEADAFASQMLNAQCGVGCESISLDQASAYVLELSRQEEVAKELKIKKKLGWPTLGFSRFVVDAVNPRGNAKFKAPAILAYRRDNEAEDKDQLSAIGSVQFWSGGTDCSAQWECNTTIGIDLDIDGAKEAHENTITAGLPTRFVRYYHDNQFLETLSLGVTPKFITDRDVNREVWEVALQLAFTSQGAGAGFLTPPAIRRDGKLPRASVYWQPALDFEFGDIRDPAGNEDLAALQERGSYSRIVPRIALTIYPWRLSEQLRFGLQYFYRFDLEQNWNRGYGEARIDYDLSIDGTFQVSALYRRGYKPPTFKKIDEFLFGVGIRQ